jgi:hypothetical protein
VPDKRTHRGPHPRDAELFAPRCHAALRQATADLSWLLSREYADVAALKLVGDRYRLRQRQRTAVMRCACSDRALARRREHQVATSDLRGQPLWIDGYNCLTSIEAALAGGVILAARDGTYRDLASVHGTYRKVIETVPALEGFGRLLADWGAAPCVWYLDRPVSNSGRLKAVILQAAADHGWDWDVLLVADPDPLLAAAEQIVATADSVILDRCRRWVNLAREVIETCAPQSNVVDLAVE